MPLIRLSAPSPRNDGEKDTSRILSVFVRHQAVTFPLPACGARRAGRDPWIYPGMG